MLPRYQPQSQLKIFEEILELHGNNIGEKLNLTGEIDYL